MSIGLTLYDIIHHLLNEAVDDDAVLDAIHNKYHVRINYDDGQDSDGTTAKASRVIQPMAIGTTKKGYPVVRAFQVGGGSRRGAPKWKFFRLDRITSWKPMRNKGFETPPDDSFGVYNRVGDKTMKTFIDNAKFDDLDSPLARAKAMSRQMINGPKVSAKNTQGPIAATQQWKKNVFTSQPNSKRYAQMAKNVQDTSNKTQDFWADYEKALQQQQQQQDRGPIKNNDNDDYNVDDVDFDENDFINNTNKR